VDAGDLRLRDNEASGRLAGHDRLVPVFILDPPCWPPMPAPSAPLRRRVLDADLRARGSRLIVRRGAPLDELAQLVLETQAAAIYGEADPWPYARIRDAEIAAQLP
jgi:deoxyribodipyrimidine photo-lyase